MGFHNDLSLNNDYKEMLKNRKSVLTEGSMNSIHQDVEDVMNDFSSTVKSEIDVDGVNAKLRDLEKLKLTKTDKQIINAIDKLVKSITKSFDDFSNFQKNLKYDFVGKEKGEIQQADGDNVDDEALSAEAELKSADVQFEEPKQTSGEDDLEGL